MEQNGAKRRLVSRESTYDCQQLNGNRLLVDSATNTECQTPMQLNAWTQTSSEDYNSQPDTSIIDALQNRIDKLEEMFRSLSSNEKIVPPTIVNAEPQQHIIDAEHLRPTQQTKYKIITSKGVEYIEPIEVVYEEDGTYHDLNTSSDSQRLEICLPKDDEEQQQQQQQQQPEQNVQQNQHQEQILYQSPTGPEQQTDHKYYSIPTLHNAQLSTVIQKSIPSQAQQQSLNSEIQSPIIETKHIVKKERKTRKSYSSCSPTTTTNNEITSTQPPRTVHDVTNVVVSLGPHNTRIPAHIYESMDWSSPTAATRKLLITIFDRETLATHTMTGKPSPAFRGRNMPLKHQLDPLVVADIIFVVSRKCGVPEKDVRNAITTKCADENKMSKQREKKRRTLSDCCNKENVVKNIPKTETY